MKNKMKKIIVCLILIIIIIGTLFINKIKFKCNIEGAGQSSSDLDIHQWKIQCLGER